MISASVSNENCEAKFTMSFSAEEFSEAVKAVYNRQKGKFEIRGFRKGRVPQSMLERHYGEDLFFADAVDELLAVQYSKALDELKIDPVGRPSLDFGEEPLKKGEGFTVTVTVPVAPEITVVDYKGVQAGRRVHTVTDEDISAELEAVRRRNARLVPVEDAAADGDTVILDYAGFVGDEQFEGGTAENQTLKLGSGSFIPGFEEQLVGCKPGDDKDVELSFPEEYHAEKLAGKPAVFKCHIREIKREELPDIDDDLAADVSEFETLDEYKASIREKLEKDAAEASEFDGKNAVMEHIYKANSFDVPDAMIETEAENMLREFSQQLGYSGMTLEQYCGYLKKKPEEIKDEFLPDAEKRVKTRLITKTIARQEGLDVSEEELEKEFEAMAKQYEMDVDKLKGFFDEENIAYMKEDIAMRKAIDLVYKAAEFTDVEAAAETPESSLGEE